MKPLDLLGELSERKTLQGLAIGGYCFAHSEGNRASP